MQGSGEKKHAWMSVIASANIADHEDLVFACPAPYFENRTHFIPLFTARYSSVWEDYSLQLQSER